MDGRLLALTIKRIFFGLGFRVQGQTFFSLQSIFVGDIGSGKIMVNPKTLE
jgi:hypothetical protein